jgi:DNA-binding CsgD family transcriptional regulator
MTSARHRQTLHRLMEGDSEKQVARYLGVSPHTVHVYIKCLFHTFNVNSRGELMARVVRHYENTLTHWRGGLMSLLDADLPVSGKRSPCGTETPPLRKTANWYRTWLRWQTDGITIYVIGRFGDDTPLKLIEMIRPDVLVKGADYTKERVVGWDVSDSPFPRCVQIARSAQNVAALAGNSGWGFIEPR